VDALRWALALFGLWLISGTALGLSHHPHWYIRGWDFPRVLIAALALATGVAYRALVFDGRWYEIAFLAALGAVIAYQASRTVAFTPLARKQVRGAARPSPECTFRLAISNLLQENREHERWLAVMKEVDPDVIVALEVDRTWRAALAALEKTHPHVVERVQDNYYGMALFSRLPLGPHQVRFLVEDDIPSIRAEIALRGGDRFRLYALHPKPPEPLRDQDSAPRDAELVLVAREIAKSPEVPTVVCGDLNDVAWSDTTRIFLRLSKMLDPRVGRFLLNTYNANNPLFRFPLDHVFHSKHFTLVRLQRLPKVGSDHFPVLIELSFEPEKAPEQRQKPAQPEEREAAAEMVERAAGDSHGA
jgi:endonuclease/exonuclease/phosphatase (EEP) superfamily protein YafD